MYDQTEQEDLQERQRFLADFEGNEYEESPEELERKERELWEEKLQVFGNGIETEAEEFERLRKPHEDRMLEDMRQYMGVQDYQERQKDDDKSRSKLNVNITRKKTNAAEARLSDMLFPNDDQNWSIDPTPIPMMPAAGQPPVPETPPQPQQSLPPQQPQEQPGVKQYDQQQAVNPGVQPQQEPVDPKEQAIRVAKEKAEGMGEEMSDQLTECKYDAVGRDMIRNGCVLGTGVMKGPVLVGKTRKAWMPHTDPKTGEVIHMLEEVEDYKPGYELVPTWDFFPTMSATKIEDSEVTFQRHWMTRKDLIKLAKRPDFMPDQIRKVLRNSPNKIPPDYLTQLRSMSEVTAVGDEKRYVVWERHGPIEVEQLQACGVLPTDYEVDELEEFHGISYVCQGIVIKAAMNPLETNDTLFSVFNFEKDDSSIFGYGVPALIREPQKVVTKSWQMIMDNSGLSVGGQVIINKSIVEPIPEADGTVSWDITPLKAWLLKDKNAKAQDAFHIFEFPNHQNELSAIFQMALQLADEESGIPPIAEGGSGPQQTQTAHGLEMLMNSHNIVMRRAVKNWDDDVTVPNITRLYDWNMQNNPNSDIKGDFAVKATGSTALLQKETQARNMLNLANFLLQPHFAGWPKIQQIAKKLVSSMQHDPDEFLNTEEEYKAWLQQKQQQQGGDGKLQIQQMKNELDLQMHKDKLADRQADRQYNLQLEQMKRETEMLKLSQTEKLSLAKITAELQKTRETIAGQRTLKADDLKAKLSLPAGKVAG